MTAGQVYWSVFIAGMLIFSALAVLVSGSDKRAGAMLFGFHNVLIYVLLGRINLTEFYSHFSLIWRPMALFAQLFGLVFYFLYKFIIEEKKSLGKFDIILIFSGLIQLFVLGFLLELGAIPERFATTTVFSILLFFEMPVTIFVVIKCLLNFKDDLVEDRRKFRLYFAVAAAIVLNLFLVPFLASIAFGFLIVGANRIEELGWLIHAIFNAGAIVVSIYAIGIAPLLLTRHGIAIFSNWTPPSVDDVVEETDQQFDDLQLVRLKHMMEHDKLYRRAGLSISRLSEMMHVPEHQLRFMINKGMGFKNFNRFLNSYRLDEAKALLSETSLVALPILTIALDLGFGSAQSFNRVFKEETGLSPTEFRQLRGSQPRAA